MFLTHETQNIELDLTEQNIKERMKRQREWPQIWGIPDPNIELPKEGVSFKTYHLQVDWTIVTLGLKDL